MTVEDDPVTTPRTAPEPPRDLSGLWVCAIHGVSVSTAVQRGIGGWPIGLCMTHKIKSILSPLVRPGEYVPPPDRVPDPLPDLSPWAALAPVVVKPGKSRGSH